MVDPLAARTGGSPLRRVLVVDDSAMMRAYIRQMLEAEGFAVDEAVNGMEGLERALQAPPDLLVVDVNMIKMDGHAMLRAVRRDAALADRPAIMISTEEKDSDRDRALLSGANWYLVKPVPPADLAAAARLLTGRGEP